MSRRSASVVACSCLALLLLQTTSAQSPNTNASTAYVRPPPSAVLHLNHTRLARRAFSTAPEQVHQSLVLSPGAVTISWVTHSQDSDALDAAFDPENKHHKKKKGRGICPHLEDIKVQSLVQWGLQPGEYTFNETGEATCYSADEYESGFLHHTKIGVGPGGPLPAMTQIHYRCGDPDLGMSQEFSFMTQPEVGPDSLPYRLGLIGDLGQTDDSAETLEHLLASNPQSVVNVGDLSYADGYQPRWDSWGRLTEPVASALPIMHIEGNHEEEVTNGEPGFLAYETRFWFPTTRSGSYSALYYSYEVAAMHIIMLGSYADIRRSSGQYAWLKRDLASIDRGRTPWVIVAMHVPWYSSNEQHQGEAEKMRQVMEAALYEFGVDVVFVGHVHAYERTHPVYDKRRTDCGIPHIVIGDGGNREGLASEYLDRPQWSAFREPSFGHGMLLLENATHAQWRWHRNQDANPVVSDDTWLVREPQCQEHRLRQQTLPTAQ